MSESKTYDLVVKGIGGGKFEARLDGRVICRSRTPMLTGARVLIRQGHDPDSIITMRHEGSSIVSMRARLGKAAGLTVNESEGSARFTPYHPPARERGQKADGFPAQTAMEGVPGILMPEDA